MKNILATVLFAFLVLGCTKEKGEEIIPEILLQQGSMTDARDGNSYKTIQIGEQEWMAENLRYRLPKGSLDGCYTYGETALSLTTLQVDKNLFIDSVNQAIARKEIVNPPNLPAIQQPTVIIALNIKQMTPSQLMSRLVPYPAVVAVLERINKSLQGPAAIIQSKINLEKAEAENGNYSKVNGFLYTHKAALDVAPAGWRLANDEDWKILEKSLGMNDHELDAMESWRGKVASFLLAKGKTNLGFDAQLSGGRVYGSFVYGSPFVNKGVNGYYWTASEHVANDSTSFGIHRSFMQSKAGILRGTAKKEAAYPIKCIKIK